MINTRYCNDTIDCQASITTAARTWRRWFDDGLALLRADTASLFGLVVIWQKRARMRYELAALDARSLKDMGLSRADRDWEVAKPFWRA